MCSPSVRRYLGRMSNETAKALTGRPLDRVGLMSLVWAGAFLALAAVLMLVLR